MSEPLVSRVIEDARVEAYKHPHVAPPPRGFHGGLVLGDDAIERRLRHTRKRAPVDTFDETAEFLDQLDGRHVYGGGIYSHFGHTMSEMVHRILPVLQIEQDPQWVFLATQGHPARSFDKWPEWHRQIYEFLGVNLGRAKILTQNTLVESLLVVESGSDMGSAPYDAYLDILDATTSTRLDREAGASTKPSRIYVSRTGTALQGSFLGERYLESLLAEEGFTIFHPEAHPFVEQMDFYRKAKIVIFPEGSACHGTELLGRAALGTCLFLPRRSGHEHIFDKVLRPRSQDFKLGPMNIYLGTVAKHPVSGAPLSYLGVSLFELHQLVRMLREMGVARLPTVSLSAYLDVAEADLSLYLQQKAAENAIDEPAFVQQLLLAFAAEREKASSTADRR